MKILEDRTVYPTDFSVPNFVGLVETDYEDNNGKRKTWQWVTRLGKTKSVAIAAIVDGRTKRIAIIEEYRIPLKQVGVELPAGLIEPGDTVLQTAEKELFQETNLELDRVLLQSPFLYNSPGLTDEQTAIVFVEAHGEVSNKNIESSEVITPKLLDVTEATTLMHDAVSGKINLGFKAWFAVSLFANGRLDDMIKRKKGD